jgi:hypothetical protein
MVPERPIASTMRHEPPSFSTLIADLSIAKMGFSE